MQHIQVNYGIRAGQQWFRKGWYSLTNLISFYNKVTCLVDDRKAVWLFFTWTL